MKAPFPYFGGKSRVAREVWQRFGAVRNYVEPFMGSGAVLLARPDWTPGALETVNDADGPDRRHHRTGDHAMTRPTWPPTPGKRYAYPEGGAVYRFGAVHSPADGIEYAPALDSHDPVGLGVTRGFFEAHITDHEEPTHA